MVNLVIVDTSIWIDFFSGNLSSNEKTALLSLLESRQVAITDIIRHEILVGAVDERDYAQLGAMLSSLQEFSIAPEWFSDFTYFSFTLRKQGLQGRFTDLAIAFLAKHNGFSIFSRDGYFKKLAQKKIISLFES